jgi:integrase
MSRRGRNEGSIYQRPDGRWVGMASWIEAGKRRRRAVYGETKREATDKLRTVQRSIEDGQTVTSDRETVATFLDRWLRDSAAPTVRSSTLARYHSLVVVHIKPGLGSIRLSRLGPADVQRFLNDRSATGLSPRRVQYLHAVLRRALGQALRWGLVTRNVASLVDPPRVRRAEVQPLTTTQARELLEAARGDRLEAIYTVALALGLRQGEILGLRWDDVDLDAGTVRIRNSLQRLGPGWELVEPKSARSRRTIAMPAIATAALRAHRIRQLEERVWAGSRWQEHGFVFTSTIGTPLNGSNVTHRFQVLLETAGLPHQRFHDLRHAAATLLLAQGVSARVVMEILGHSQIALTMNTYSHVAPELQRDAADRMDAVLGVARQ